MTEGLYGEVEEEEVVESNVELPQTKRPVRAGDRKSKKQRRRQREMKEEVGERGSSSCCFRDYPVYPTQVKRRLSEKSSRIKMEEVYRYIMCCYSFSHVSWSYRQVLIV